MNREERFHRSVNVLATAYREGTLEAEDCKVCAIGNLCADALNLKIGITEYGGHQCYQWQNQEGVEYEDAGSWMSPLFAYRNDDELHCYDEGLRQMRATGYTIQEIHIIEHAFEYACGTVRGDMNEDGSFIEDFDYASRPEDVTEEAIQYAGLVAVYEVLCEIHEVPVVDQVEPNLLFFKEEAFEYQADMVKIEV